MLKLDGKKRKVSIREEEFQSLRTDKWIVARRELFEGNMYKNPYTILEV
jgi:hypothetical protein